MEYGSFIYNNNFDSVNLLIFKKSTPEELKAALPTTYDEIKNKDDNYLSVIFQNGLDYLGCTIWDNIDKMISDTNAVDILSGTKDDIATYGLKISEKEYNNMRDFAKNQLKLG